MTVPPKSLLLALLSGAWIVGAAPAATPVSPAIRIVAAENFYGDVAAQLAGPAAQVVSILHNPAEDPHLFEADVAAARALAGADLVIYNGLNYDPWMVKLLAGAPAVRRRVIVVAALMQLQAPIANPHLWYDPATMPALARALTVQLQRLDPSHSAGYAQRLQRFLESMRPINGQISQLRHRYAGEPVAATEPVANYLAAAVGLDMREQRFQLAVMNDTEPGARETAAFEQALKSGGVRVLIFNPQASGSAVQRLLGIAGAARVPVVGMTETEPPGADYQQWMLAELSSLGAALSGTHP